MGGLNGTDDGVLWPEPVRVLRAAHRNARSRMSRAARREVADRADQVAEAARRSGIAVDDPTVREAWAWLLLAVGGAPNRDDALQVMIELVADRLPDDEQEQDDG